MASESVSSKSFNPLGFLASGRFWLAGPLAFLVSVTAMGTTSLWFPQGNAGVDHLVFPLIFFPLYWVTAFVYSLLETKLSRAAVILGALFVVNGGVMAASIAGVLA